MVMTDSLNHTTKDDEKRAEGIQKQSPTDNPCDEIQWSFGRVSTCHARHSEQHSRVRAFPPSVVDRATMARTTCRHTLGILDAQRDRKSFTDEPIESR